MPKTIQREIISAIAEHRAAHGADPERIILDRQRASRACAAKDICYGGCDCCGPPLVTFEVRDNVIVHRVMGLQMVTTLDEDVIRAEMFHPTLKPFYPGELVEFCGERGIVIKDFCHCGIVDLGSGERCNWHWDFQGETVKRVRV